MRRQIKKQISIQNQRRRQQMTKTDSKTDIDTKPKTPTTDAKDKAPETGDSSCMALYLVLMGIAAMSGARVLRRKNK